jgi:hypothetical protein
MQRVDCWNVHNIIENLNPFGLPINWYFFPKIKQSHISFLQVLVRIINEIYNIQYSK